MAALGRLFGGAASKGASKAGAKGATSFGQKAKKLAFSTFGQTALATVGIGLLMNHFSGSSSGSGSGNSFMA
jgi:hypothetical protein